MRSTELHGERRSWNHHLVRWVVCSRRMFLEVRIFRDVRHKFQKSIAHHFTAAPAVGKNCVAHQKHVGARLIMMANLVDPRLTDQLSGSQGAIALLVCFDVCFDVGVLQFHIVALYLFPSFRPEARRSREQLGQSKMGCVQGSHKLEHCC